MKEVLIGAFVGWCIRRSALDSKAAGGLKALWSKVSR